MFIREDIYTSSGAVKLWGCWTENVTKHDTSSFYNWEQDNEPLYDLEERTHLNWEQHGYPASSVPGIALTVSAHAPAASVVCNSNLFTSVSAALAALPQTLNFPVVIEVANFGALGKIELDNIRMGPNGSLEIINRNFVKGYAASNVVLNTHSLVPDYDLVGAISSLDLSNTFYGGASSLSALDISTTVWSAVADIRVPNNYSVFTELTKHASTSQRNHRLSTCLYSSDIRSVIANQFLASAYEVTYEGFGLETDVWEADVSTINTISNSPAFREWDATNGKATSLIYGNNLTKVRIRNCDGPLYLRGFFVDGSYSTDVGVEIHNCANVILENCASIRNTKQGFLIENSHVTVTRGLIGYRNYNLHGNGYRDYGVSGDWSAVSSFDSDAWFEKYPGTGLEARHSTINFSSTLSLESGYGASASDFIVNLSRNMRGIVLDNSIIIGGIHRAGSVLDGASRIAAELNLDKGLSLNNSEIYLDGILDVHGNRKGAVARNSILELDHLIVENNQFDGLHLINSTFRYNKNPYQLDPIVAYQFSANGQHLVVDKGSNVETIYYSGMDSNAFAMEFTMPFGTHTDGTQAHRTLLPAISVKNNSNATFAQTFIQRTVSEVLGAETEAVYGAAVEIRNSSKAKFQGTKTRCTSIEGPNTYAGQKNKAAVYVGDNSEVEFNGPTVIHLWAVDVLAENNSTMNFNPPRNKSGGYDVSSFNLNNYLNHTGVELHSTRACLVAVKNSTINIRDLGDFQTRWTGTNGLAALAEQPDFVTSSTGQEFDYAISAGYMQLYPNTNDPDAYTAGLAKADPNTIVALKAFSDFYAIADYTDFVGGGVAASAVTTGGTAVRALENSVVNVRNVNFPCGFNNPSALYYSISGIPEGEKLCYMLHIWNIADNSQLHASYLSVSSAYPSDAGYFGPSAVYASAGGPGGGAAYTSPTGTPDTSSLSVLDFYGQRTGVTNWPTPPNGALSYHYGQSTPLNQGPFRIYVGVDSLANQLYDIGAAASGHIIQIFAQGYNVSSNLALQDTTASALYGKALKFNDSNALTTSGWFYCSSFVSPDTHKRILLDESAANTFANAKNGAMGTSGRPQIVTIYKAHTTLAGESASVNYKSSGRGAGFKSPNVFDLDRDN